MEEYEHNVISRVQGNPMSDDEIESLRKEGWEQTYEQTSPVKLPADVPRSVYIFKRAKKK